MTEKLTIVGVLIAGLALLFACIVVAAGVEARDLIHRRLAAARARLRASSWALEAPAASFDNFP
jgi:hypothetical protein